MSIYEKTTKELMHEFAAEKLKPGQVFSRAVGRHLTGFGTRFLQSGWTFCTTIVLGPLQLSYTSPSTLLTHIRLTLARPYRVLIVVPD